MSDLGAFLMARLDHEEAQVRALAAADGVDEELLDSAHRLADIDAKRRIINLHWPAARGFFSPELFRSPVCEVCCEDTYTGGQVRAPCKTLRLLALPYADHPNYRPEWRA